MEIVLKSSPNCVNILLEQLGRLGKNLPKFKKVYYLSRYFEQCLISDVNPDPDSLYIISGASPIRQYNRSREEGFYIRANKFLHMYDCSDNTDDIERFIYPDSNYIPDWMKKTMKIIKDKKENTIGYVINNLVYLTFNIDLMEENESSEDAIKYIINQIMYYTIPKPFKQDEKKLATQIKNWMSYSMQRRIENIKNNLRQKEDEVSQSRQYMINGLRDIKNMRLSLKGFDEEKLEQKDGMKIIKQLKEISKVRSVYVSDNNDLVVHTDVITCKNVADPKQKEKIGSFRIVIRRDGGLRIYNKDVISTYDYNHPHITRGGDPCLGNLSDTVAKLLAEYEIIPLINLLIPYLESYNPADAHEHLNRFMRDAFPRMPEKKEETRPRARSRSDNDEPEVIPITSPPT